MGNTGFIGHPLYLKHIIDPYHPESPERLLSIYNMIERDLAGELTAIAPREVSREELGWIHDASYIDRVAATEGRSVRLDPDTGTSPDSYRAALLSAGGLLAAVDAIFDGTVQNAFTATRPPGHHAEAGHSSGFCLFNNVAIAAEYARRNHGAHKVLIFDWDLHHGNGTQHSFESSDRVLYVSTHQFPYFPGTGNFDEIGHGAGKHFTINLPMSSGFGDGDFLLVLDRIIKPVALAYRPDFIIVSAGYDTYEHDPLGAMNVSTHGYGALTHRMIELARECCQGRILFTLEGGYHLEGLTEGVRNTLQTMLAGECPPEWLAAPVLRDDAIERIIRRVVNIHQPFWTQLVR
jgi:acetoin utilization deacetylase AcuC-like enzyme